jgi:hypothetical protein
MQQQAQQLQEAQQQQQQRGWRHHMSWVAVSSAQHALWATAWRS